MSSRLSRSNQLRRSLEKFEPDLAGLTVLTEAASGNYLCTPIIAAMSGAKVFAIGKDTEYGSFHEIAETIKSVATECGVYSNISLMNSFDDVPLSSVDIVTNTGHVRPINESILTKLNSDCVISLMYEPWEFRSTDLDLELARELGLVIVGTNEDDPRLRTQRYIGLTVLYFILENKLSPFSAKVLVVGSKKFNAAIHDVLDSLDYSVKTVDVDENTLKIDMRLYNVVVFADMIGNTLLVGGDGALIEAVHIDSDVLLVHIAGRVDFNAVRCKYIPEKPAAATKMSFTTDFIDPLAVYDLHTAGLLVAEGVIQGRRKGLPNSALVEFVEQFYPAIFL